MHHSVVLVLPILPQSYLNDPLHLLMFGPEAVLLLTRSDPRVPPFTHPPHKPSMQTSSLSLPPQHYLPRTGPIAFIPARGRWTLLLKALTPMSNLPTLMAAFASAKCRQLEVFSCGLVSKPSRNLYFFTTMLPQVSSTTGWSPMDSLPLKVLFIWIPTLVLFI